MNPVTHFFVSWLAADASADNRRDRAIITISGIIPDIDGIGAPFQLLSNRRIAWFTDYHHVLCHNIGFCLLVTATAVVVAKKRLRTAIAAFLVFHIHLLCDIIGSHGPNISDIWTIPYLLPFNKDFELSWSGQWRLFSWQNAVITIAALAFTFFLAWKRGHSPVEIFSPRADRAFVETLRTRFPRKKTMKTAPTSTGNVKHRE